MNTQTYFNSAGTLGMLVAFAGLACPMVSPAIDLIENFDGDVLDETVWERTSDLAPTVDSGRLTWGPGGGNWASGDISTTQPFFLPPAGETTVIEWTLAPGSVTVPAAAGGSAIRMQMGIHSVNETAARREHWPNTKGGVWLDLDNINPDNPGTAAGAYRYANDTKAFESQATQVAGATSDWNWQTESRVYRLEITDTGFKWFDKTASADTPTAEQDWASAGIDIEFDNGFRVLALGMNFNDGRGTMAVDQIAITNAFGPSSLITNFSATRPNPFSGQTVNLTWTVDPGSTVTLDQTIGNVDDETVDGIGSYPVTPGDVTEPTSVVYVLTATKGEVTSTRSFALNVQPPPELQLTDFADHFEGEALDLDAWQHRGDKTYTIANSKINWDANGSNWSHGEVDSARVFPLPGPGRVTTIKWTLGPADVTVAGPGGATLRPVMGICSAFETDGWSRQHWQNTTGGLWMDVTSMGDNLLTGVSGNLHASDDTKLANNNAATVGNFTISNWNWETDTHEITLELTNTGFTWFNGPEALGSRTWEEVGIDTEFSKGFRILMAGANWDSGRGPMSLDAVSLINAAPLTFEIQGVVHDEASDTATVTFKSTPGVTYSLDTSATMGTWNSVNEILATSSTTTLNDTTASGAKAFYRIRNVDLKPLP